MEKSGLSPETSSSNDLRKEQGTRVRKTVGVTIQMGLLAEARKRGLNISKITEEALTRMLEDSSATKMRELGSKTAVTPTDMEAGVTRVPENPVSDLGEGQKTGLEPEVMSPETKTFATRVGKNTEEASGVVPERNSGSNAAHDSEARVRVSPIDRLALALSTVMEPCDISEESGYLMIKAKRELTPDEHLHVLEIVCALGGHSSGKSELEWKIGPVQDANKAKNNFEESFGALAGAVSVEEFETHIEVRPKRKLTVREFMQVNDVVRKHGGRVGGICQDNPDLGAWFTVPVANHED